MKGFWKWFWIVVGVILLALLAFGVMLFFLRSFGRGGMMFGRGLGGGMRLGLWGGMFGMGWMMFARWLFLLGILVLAGFGVAYFVRYSEKPVAVAAPAMTCSHCGKPLQAEWTSCPYCGTKIEPPAIPPQA